MSERSFRVAPAAALLLALAAACTPTGSDSVGDPEPGTAFSTLAEIRVIDGDSLEADVDGERLEIRLEGYNAPELHGLDNAVACNGERAKAALADLLDGAPATFRPDGIDRYGRVLGEVEIGGRSVVENLIADGWGLATGDDENHRASMIEAAATARGIWGDGCGMPVSPAPTIDAVLNDPPGDDRYNLTEEWVRIVNPGPRPVVLDRWVLRDDTTGHRFELDGTLGASATLTVRTGSGTSTDTDHYLGERYPVWSNSNETVILVDPHGVLTDWRFLP